MHRCDCDPVIRHMYQEIASEPHSKHPSGPNHRTQVSSERASVLISTPAQLELCAKQTAVVPPCQSFIIVWYRLAIIWSAGSNSHHYFSNCRSARARTHTHNSAPYHTSVESVAFAVSVKNAFTNRVNKWKAHPLQLGQHIKHASLLWQQLPQLDWDWIPQPSSRQLRNFATLDSTKHVWMSENLPTVRNARQGEEDKNRCEMVPGRWTRYMPMDSASKR